MLLPSVAPGMREFIALANQGDHTQTNDYNTMWSYNEFFERAQGKFYGNSGK